MLPKGTSNLNPAGAAEESPNGPPNLKPSDTEPVMISVVPNLKPPEFEIEDPKVEDGEAPPAGKTQKQETNKLLGQSKPLAPANAAI